MRQTASGSEAEQAAEGREELRLANQHFGFVARKRNRGEIAVPIEAGGQLAQRGPLELVVVLLGVAQVHERARGFRQLGFQGHDGIGGGLGRRGRVAGQFEHAGDVRHVGGADLLRILPLAKIVVALRQAEAALTKARDHGRGVLVVDLHVEVEADVQALGLQLGDDRNQFLGARDRLNAAQPRRERPQSFAVDRGLVHAGCVEVADALDHAALGSAGPSRILEDFLEDGEVALVDFLVHAIGGVFAGDRHFLEGAIGVGIEVFAGRDGQIHVRPVHAADRLGGNRGFAGRLPVRSLVVELSLAPHRAGSDDQDHRRRY